MSKASYYFSHDNDARNDDKIISVRMKFGGEGYAAYFMILERLMSCTDYVHKRNYNEISFDLHIEVDIIKSVIEDFELFKFTQDGKYFYSDSFNNRMEPLDNLRKQRSIAGKKSAEKRNLLKNSPTTVENKTNDRCENKPTKNDIGPEILIKAKENSLNNSHFLANPTTVERPLEIMSAVEPQKSNKGKERKGKEIKEINKEKETSSSSSLLEKFNDTLKAKKESEFNRQVSEAAEIVKKAQEEFDKSRKKKTEDITNNPPPDGETEIPEDPPDKKQFSQYLDERPMRELANEVQHDSAMLTMLHNQSFKADKPTLKLALRRFVEYQEAVGVTEKTKNDFKRHFLNWLNKQPSDEFDVKMVIQKPELRTVTIEELKNKYK